MSDNPINNFNTCHIAPVPNAAEAELAKALAEMAKAAAVIGEALKGPRAPVYGVYIEAPKTEEGY